MLNTLDWPVCHARAARDRFRVRIHTGRCQPEADPTEYTMTVGAPRRPHVSSLAILRRSPAVWRRQTQSPATDPAHA